MTEMPRYIKIDDWFFEIKTARALRSSNYGDKYSAIANFNFNGNNAYVDGLMTQSDNNFTYRDFQTFKKFCSQLGIKKATFDRFKNNELKSESVIITPDQPKSLLQLVN